MTFEDVIQAVKATPGASFTGHVLRADGLYLGVYTISSSDDEDDQGYDPEWVDIYFHGGLLFSSSGEENTYSLDEAPNIVRSLIYRPSTSVPDISGLCSEYALHRIFPQLPDPESLWTADERRAFVKKAIAVAQESGVMTIADQM